LVKAIREMGVIARSPLENPPIPSSLCIGLTRVTTRKKQKDPIPPNKLANSATGVKENDRLFKV